MSEILQLKIELEDTPVWRRLLINKESSFSILHLAIQMAMEWKNSHLHEFKVDKERYIGPQLSADTGTCFHEKKTRLSEFLSKRGDSLLYIYDFGDNWVHQLLVESVLKEEEGKDYPLCTDGEKKAPPEDCGGAPGYHRLVEVMSNPNHEEYEEFMSWLGSEFKADQLDLDEINSQLSSLS